MGDLGGLTSQVKSPRRPSEGTLNLGVPCLDAACTVGLNYLSVARNPEKPIQNKLKNKKRQRILVKKVIAAIHRVTSQKPL